VFWLVSYYQLIMKEYHDSEVLKKLYHEKEMSQHEIADKFGVCQATIHKWMKKNNLETRKANDEKPPCYQEVANGYRCWRHTIEGNKQRVLVHRLLAVSKFGINAVADNIVHHKNGCRFDNRPDNIEIMTRGKHTTLHNNERANNNNY